MPPPTFANTPIQTIEINKLPKTRFLDKNLPYRDQQGHVNIALLKHSMQLLNDNMVQTSETVKDKLKKWLQHAQKWENETNPEKWTRNARTNEWHTPSGLVRKETSATATKEKPQGSKRPPTNPPAPAAKRRIVASSSRSNVTQVRSAAPVKRSTGGHVSMKIKAGCRAPVDPSCPIAEKCHVYETGKDTFDILLNQTNIAKNNNKYYIIQLLASDATPTEYYCWNRWGRVGEERNYQNALRGPMPLDAAYDDFCKKFRDKTKNDWTERHKFQTYPDKYTLLERDYGNAIPVAESSQSTAPSKLDKSTKSFIELITDSRRIEQDVREIGFNSDQLPLGKLQKTTISKAYSILKQLSAIIESSSPAAHDEISPLSRSALKSTQGKSGRGVAHNGDVVALSNAFYSLIPHISRSESGGTRARLQIIGNRHDLMREMKIVDALANVQLASRILNATSFSAEPLVHPLDYKYAQFKTRLEPLSQASEAFKLLEKMLKLTHAPTHDSYDLSIVSAFEVEREGEAQAFHDVGNRRLLWHGSRISNWAGILSGGLRIAPPEAPVTGYMFGKGLYFADMVSKATNYCHATEESPIGVAVLCEVAMGQCYERLQAEYEGPKKCAKLGKHSTWARGKTTPDPSQETFFPGDSGLKVHVGAPVPAGGVDKSSLLYNEYIVYDPRQVRQRFVLQLKFNFGK